MLKLLSTLYKDTFHVSGLIYKFKKILRITTQIEITKKYAGSFIGRLWVVLYPILFLCIYLFLYLVMLGVRFPDLGGTLGYAVYVFCGLIPYIGFMECMNSGCMCVKQNIHLIRNVMLPIEIIPVRVVLVSMTTQIVGLAMLLFLTVLNGTLTLHILWLPLVVILQIMAFCGLTWLISPMAVLLPDIGYFTNLFVLFLLFISPIGFRPDMVAAKYRFLVYINPIYHLSEPFRCSVLYGKIPSVWVIVIYISLALGLYIVGASFFSRFKNILVDYE